MSREKPKYEKPMLIDFKAGVAKGGPKCRTGDAATNTCQQGNSATKQCGTGNSPLQACGPGNNPFAS